MENLESRFKLGFKLDLRWALTDLKIYVLELVHVGGGVGDGDFYVLLAKAKAHMF